MASGCIAGRNTEPSVASQCRSMEAAAGDVDSFVQRETASGISAVTAKKGDADAAVTGTDISAVTAKQGEAETVVTGPEISAVTAKQGAGEAVVTGPDIAAVTANGKEVVTGRELPTFSTKRTGDATGKEMSPFMANGEPIITIPGMSADIPAPNEQKAAGELNGISETSPAAAIRSETPPRETDPLNPAATDQDPDDAKPSPGIGEAGTRQSILLLYLSRALTAWGDRLWSFGLGMFLFRIQPENLMLLAGFGLARSLTSILFGAAIGAWIDRTGRLRSAVREKLFSVFHIRDPVRF
jgi:hypothetical protein